MEIVLLDVVGANNPIQSVFKLLLHFAKYHYKSAESNVICFYSCVLGYEYAQGNGLMIQLNCVTKWSS